MDESMEIWLCLEPLAILTSRRAPNYPQNNKLSRLILMLPLTRSLMMTNF